MLCANLVALRVLPVEPNQMSSFQNILVEVHGDSIQSGPWRRAGRIATHSAARLTLVRVLEEFPWYTRLVIPRSGDLLELIERDRTEQLQRLAEAILEESPGTVLDVEVLRGHCAVELTRAVLRHGHDLLIKEAEDEAVGVFGSTDLRLLRYCPCPVWITRRGERDAPYRRIVAAIDPIPDDKDRNALDEQILETALRIGEIEGPDTEVHVIHAWSAPGELLLRSGPHRVPQRLIDEYSKQMEDEIKRTIDRFLDPFRGRIAPERVHLLNGEARAVLSQFVSSREVDLVVMGTLGRARLVGLLMGNTAETILGQLGCSVLALKPPAFVSPVRLDDAPHSTSSSR